MFVRHRFGKTIQCNLVVKFGTNRNTPKFSMLAAVTFIFSIWQRNECFSRQFNSFLKPTVYLLA